jgi:hypothetical protein
MDLVIRWPRGTAYSEAVSDMLIENEHFEIHYAHFWQDAIWRLKNKSTKEFEYIIRKNYSTYSKEELICKFVEHSEGKLSVDFSGDLVELNRIDTEGIICRKEIWNARCSECMIGRIEYSRRFLLSDRLRASFETEKANQLLLCSFYIWENCRERFYPPE